MALKRAAAPLTASVFHIPYAPQPAGSIICFRCMYNIYPSPTKALSRRCFVSATAHRPNNLETQAPPRNDGIPDTSIAGGEPQVDDPRPIAEQRAHPEPTSLESPTFSITEKEAQKSKPTPQQPAVGSVASPEPAPSSRPQRKSKLKPRKAAMNLTPSAITALKQLLEQPEPKMIRVGVKNRGCSGLAYHLEYVDKPGSFDEAVEQEGVKVLIDSKALFSIIGSEMDWIEDKLSRRFVFKNPNITEQCGCGESFSIG